MTERTITLPMRKTIAKGRSGSAVRSVIQAPSLRSSVPGPTAMGT